MTTALASREAPTAPAPSISPSTSTPAAVRTDDRIDAPASAGIGTGVGMLAARLFGFLVVVGATVISSAASASRPAAR